LCIKRARIQKHPSQTQYSLEFVSYEPASLAESVNNDIEEDVKSTIVVKHAPRNKGGPSPGMVSWTGYCPRLEAFSCMRNR